MVLSIFALISEKIRKRNQSMDMGRAARANECEEIRRLVTVDGVDPNILDGEGSTPLMQAAGRGNYECVKLLLELGANVQMRETRKGLSALKFALARGYEDVARLLLDHGADPNETDNLNRTPLIFAAGQGNIELVRLLLELGADPNIKDGYGNAPITVAEDTHHMEIRELLLEHGAQPVERFYLGDET